MPVDDDSKIDSSKKRSKKKARTKAKTKTKQNTHNNIQTIDPVKNALNSRQSRLNKLTPANLSSLRWDDIQKDPISESLRIEEYKELRRQRYIDAQQQVIQKSIEKMQTKITDE